MTDYKAPFRVEYGAINGKIFYDDRGYTVPAETVVDLLNAHARQSAQRCETCRYAGEPDNQGTFRLCIHPDLEDAQLEPPGSGAFVPIQANGQPFGCSAYAPKEGK